MDKILLLKGGKVHSENGFIDADVLINGGKIEKIAPNINEDAETIDCTNKFVCPGFMDAHVHFREPGGMHKEDFLSGSKAAAAGGVTTVFEMPNTNPATVTKDNLEQKRELAKKSLVNYGLYVLGCKENRTNVGAFQNIPGIKVYRGSSTGGYLTDDAGVFFEILSNASRPVVVHAENEQLIQYFSEKFKETKMHHKMRDNVAAVASVAETSVTANYLAKQIHIAHMSTKQEVDFLRKNKTPNISCEACPHHLFLTEQFFREKENYGKMNPPLRYQADREALWRGIKEGIIDIVATDHAPHTKEEKDKGFFEGPCGVPGVQTMIPLLLNAVNQGKLQLTDVVRLCATNPARIFGVKDRGQVKEGAPADVCVVDMDIEQPIRNENQFSKCGWTPFDGVNVKGWPVLTIVNGHVVFNDGKIDESKKGREVEFA